MNTFWKKFLLLTSLLFLLLILFLITRQVKKVEEPQEIRIKAAPSTTLSLQPPTLTKAPNEIFSLNVGINTGDNRVSAAEIHLSFDPNKLRGKEFVKDEFLPILLVNGSVNNTTGHASIIVGSDPASPKQGTGGVAKITFTALATTGSNPTTVTFTDKTQVAAVGEPGNVVVNTSPASVTISNANLAFEIKFQGINTKRADKKVGIGFKKGGTIVKSFADVNVVADAQGVYRGRVAGIPPDTYDVFIKGPAHLQKKFGNVTLNAGENSKNWSAAPLKAGDAVANNKVDIYDYNRLVGHFGPRMPAAGSPADFDSDNDVDIFDYNFLVWNFGLIGD